MNQDGRLRQHKTLASHQSVPIASMNLHCGVGTRGQPFDVEAAVLGLDAPIIALQETWTSGSEPDQVAGAAEAMGAQLFRVPLRLAASLSGLSIPADSGPGRTGMAVLSTLPVVRYEVIDLGRMPADVVRRCAQILTIELPGHVLFRLAATHLTHRFSSPLQLGRLLRHLGRISLPTVIAGDLNMPRMLAGSTPGYRPAVRGRTWPAELPVVQLDHLLTSRRVRAGAGIVLPPAGSDHLPVRAQIAVS
jgi:endonuclease/exonuclease/phosphatase family metal-dependent hydrolase